MVTVTAGLPAITSASTHTALAKPASWAGRQGLTQLAGEHFSLPPLPGRRAAAAAAALSAGLGEGWGKRNPDEKAWLFLLCAF